MRTKRLTKFKKYRHRKTRRLFLFVIIIPLTSIFLGYVLTSLFILPIMSRWFSYTLLNMHKNIHKPT